MDNVDDITKTMIDEDLVHSRQLWNQYGDDAKRMSGLFDMLILRYKDMVDGIADGLDVISSFDTTEQKADVYKNNVHKLIIRLEAFKDCGYSNESLARHYVNEGVHGTVYDLSFNETRDIINKMDDISKEEKEEIIGKIDEIESITNSVNTKKNKWYALRPYLMWVSGKEANIAMLILPLIMKIN